MLMVMMCGKEEGKRDISDGHNVTAQFILLTICMHVSNLCAVTRRGLTTLIKGSSL